MGEKTINEQLLFLDMMDFTKWLLKVDDMDNINRYVYIESKEYFIDDDRNRYTWKDMYEIYITENSQNI